MKTIVIKSQITLIIDEDDDEEALLKANDWHQRVGRFLALVDKTPVSYTHLTLPTICSV